MDIQTVLGTLWLCVLVSSVQSYIMHIDAHAEECFFDKVTSGTKMSLMFEVAEGGFLDIDVQVESTHVYMKSRSRLHSTDLCSSID